MKLSIILFTLIYIYKAKPMVGLSLNVGLIVGCLIYISSIFYYNELEPHGITRGFSILDFENWMHFIHLPTINRLWSYITPIFVVYLISKGFKLNSIETVNRIKWISILTIIAITSFLLPTIWGPLNNYKTPMIVAIYSIFYRLLSMSFYVLIIIFVSSEKIFQHINRNNDYYDNNKLSPSIDNVNNNTYNKQRTRNFYLRRNSKIDQFIQSTVILLRSTYYVHVAVFIWYYSSQKWPILPSKELIGHMFYAIFLAIHVGLVFQLIILGPFVSLIVEKVGNNRLFKTGSSQMVNLPLTRNGGAQ
ncbi:uncharacterized protein LOC128394082 [Panonychus citri]|uniref:uncharacterized protein LOC128394082 n=1 Tax=Panonychus citri TaxID=50023 RepID=UPI0023076F56|nr:uncharacterized protein LOC128394082 [Panonychus citri]